MLKKTGSALLAILVVLGTVMPAGFIAPAYAAVLSREAEADLLYFDGTIYTDDESQRLYVGVEENGDNISRAAYRFNLGTIPGRPTQYELRLNVIDVEVRDNNEFYLDIKGSADNGMTDNGPSFNFPLPDPSSPTIRVPRSDLASNVANSVLIVDVTSVVNAYTSPDDRNVTFILTGNETLTDLNRILTSSKEESDASKRPQLVVTYTENSPPTGSIVINGGAPYTNSASVNLNLTSDDADGNPIEMRFSHDKVDWSAWEPAAATKSWTLTAGEDVKTVYYQLRDDSDAESEIYQDSITLDMTAPAVTGVTGGVTYTTPVTITANEGTATLNGAPFTLGSQVGDDGSYTLIVTDAAGNTTTVAFAIDRTPPQVTGVTDGSFYNTNRTITFNEGTATLNGSAFVSGTVVGEEGDYTLIASDAAGNTTTIRFLIDKTAPTVTGVVNGEPYSVARTITFNEGTATLNGNPFVSGSTVSDEGSYTLVVTDPANNVTSVSFSIDRTAPIVTGVTDGSLYNTDRTITFNEGTAMLNGRVFVSGTVVGEDDDYTLVVSDAAGNETTVKFTVDQTPPTVIGVTDGERYNTDRTITFNEGTAALNGDPFGSGSAVTEDGEYTLIVTDQAGNETKIEFAIDRTPPVVTGVTDGSSYNTDRTVTFNEGTAALNGNPFVSGTAISNEGAYALIVTDAAGNTVEVNFAIDKTPPSVSGAEDGKSYNTDRTVTFDEGEAMLNGEAFASGGRISEDGNYTLIVTDAAGNLTMLTFAIDQQPPVVDGVEDEESYNTDRTITFNEGTAVLNGQPFVSGTSVSEEGEYTLVVTDDAGNLNTVFFTMDKTSPVVTGAADKGRYTSAVTVTFNEGTAALNARPFASGSTISAGGDYTLTVTDRAGNQTALTFNITLPVSNPDPGNPPVDNGTPVNAGGGSPVDSGSSENGNAGGGTPSPSGSGILVNGQLQQIAQVRVETRDGRPVTIVTINEQRLEEQIRDQPAGTVISIPVDAADVIAELNGRIVKAMDNKAIILQIQSNQADYTIPIEQLNIDRISRDLGVSASLLQNIKLAFAVTQASEEQLRRLSNGLNGSVRIAPAVDFSITADYGGKAVEVKRFDMFVQRSIAIPNEADASKITTGVVLTNNGTLSHVPTRTERKDGKTYAVINSLTNSLYSVVYREKSFSDTVGHWAQSSIEDMASRMVVQGVNESQFLPKQKITRAEFTAILVRSLGLHTPDQPSTFRDVRPGDWFYEAVSLGSDYGLVKGFDSGEFRPDQNITREEALVLLSRAMELSGTNMSASQSEQDRILGRFSDADEFHAWSKQAAAFNAQAGILTGYQGLASPSVAITRAETTVMIQRLLQQAGLI